MMAHLIAGLIIVVIALQLVQIRQHYTAQSWPRPSAPRQDHVPLVDTITLRLLSPKGAEEFEVGWHRGELPSHINQAGERYFKGGKRADGSVEYHRR